MTTGEWVIAFATFIGPISAVFVTRLVDKLRSDQDRRLMIFRALMKDRANPLSYDFISALNLIEIEFHRKDKVIAAWKALSQNFSEQAVNESGWQKIFSERRAKTTKLLSEIGSVVRMPIEQLDIFEGGYKPDGWYVAENRQIEIQNKLLGVLSGENPIRIAPYQQESNAVTPAEAGVHADA